MTTLTSNQIHNMATPRRGNLVHKLTANFRDPDQLAKAQREHSQLCALVNAFRMTETLTPDNSASL